MSNWGKPDFDSRSKEQQAIDAAAPALREKLKLDGFMYEWPRSYKVQAGYNPAEVQIICVRHAEWQKVRLSMKGKYTHEKLRICKDWWDMNNKHADALEELGKKAEAQNLRYDTEVQVGNYLGALRRGGQLDMNNQVRRYI
jgi:hypothetical protein